MSLELISRINELVKDPQCVYQALDSILPHCQVSINTIERQSLAIQITICDYEAAGLAIAPQCLGGDQRSCIKALESRSQWWTSYTANYQTIGQICIEMQPEYEAQNAAQLHRNLSQVTKNYLVSLEEAYAELSVLYKKSELHATILDELDQAFSHLQSQVSLLTDQLGGAQESSVQAQEALDTLEKQNTHLAFLQSQVIQQVMAAGVGINQLYSQIEHKIQSVSDSLDIIAEAALEVQELQNQTMENALYASEITESTVEALRFHTGILIDIVSRLGQFLQILVSFWWVFVTIVVIIILNRTLFKPTTAHISGIVKRGSSRRSCLHI